MVKREDLFITGKLWNSDHDVEIVPKACAHSLSNLGLDYFDLYLIHFPICWKHTGISTPSWGSSELGTTPLIDTWRAMEELVEKGVCKSIGVSNYPMMLMHDLVSQAKVQPACNQIEVHAYYQRESLVNYCLARNVSTLSDTISRRVSFHTFILNVLTILLFFVTKICVTAHTPLGGGIANAESWSTPIPLQDKVITDIANAHKKSPAQVLLRSLLQRGIVVLPKSVKAHRMAENKDILDFSLTEEEMKQIATLDKYVSYKTNPNPLSAFLGGKDAYSPQGTDIFD